MANDDVRQALQAGAASTDRAPLSKACSRAAAILVALENRGHDRQDIAEFLDRYDRALGRPTAKGISRITSDLLAHLEKQHGLVEPGHYRNQWMAIGMSVFGLPLGVAFSAALDSYAYIGIGLPIGLAIGMALGSRKDDEAASEGRLLEMDEE